MAQMGQTDPRERIKRLSRISDSSDIQELRACIYPGGHCPLFGVHLTLEPIAGVTLLVLGTADCGFYTFKTMKNFSDPARSGARVCCAVLEESDVISGSARDLKKILACLDQDPDTRLIVVVTSCVIELIGDDIQGIVQEADMATPTRVIQTENFKTADYTQGIEQALEAVTCLVPRSEKTARSFSILGPRFKGVTENQVIQTLIRQGFSIRAEFPCNTSLSEVRAMAGADFALVTDRTALKLAQQMHQTYDIPFADLSPTASWAGIRAGYDQLAGLTGISFARDLASAKERINRMKAILTPEFRGKTVIIGNGMGSPFEAACLVAQTGATIEMILAGHIHDKDRDAISRLLALGQDPWVAQNANTAALDTISKWIRADFHMGMAWARHRETGPARFLSTGTLFPWAGTDYPERFYAGLTACIDQAKEARS